MLAKVSVASPSTSTWFGVAADDDSRVLGYGGQPAGGGETKAAALQEKGTGPPLSGVRSRRLARAQQVGPGGRRSQLSRRGGLGSPPPRDGELSAGAWWCFFW